MRNRRINLVFILIVFFGATIIIRLVCLQVFEHERYLSLAMGQQRLSQIITPPRGEIFVQDKTGSPYILATNQEAKLVFVSPSQVENKEKTAEELANILELEKEEVLEKLNIEENLFVVIKRRLSEEEIAKIEVLEDEGVYLRKESFRYYPEEDLASHVLGFVGGEGYGQYGLEAFYEEDLRGIEGLAEGEKNSKGYIVFFDSEKSIPAQKGSSLLLGIDYYIQFEAERLLKKAQEELEIEDGLIVVLDPNTGKIITAAVLSSYNPNQYSEYNLEIFIDPLSQKIFEPGSVFKPITMAIGLEEEAITPQTTYIDKGFVTIGPDTIYNYDNRVYGETTMTEVLERSINTGAVFAEQEISHNVFLKYIEKFGIFEKTGIDIQGEVASQNEEFKKGYEINFATAAFGQGIEMTPVQLIRAFSVFANGGKLVRPYLVEEATRPDGTVVRIDPKIQDSSVISRNTASKITAMLVSVIENGFGKSAGIPGYYIAGKTGTAQVPWSALGINKAGYSDKTIQTFIGFAPAFNPRFLILVKLNNPKTRTAEYSAVPIFRNLAKYVIDYYHIPPDYEE